MTTSRHESLLWRVLAKQHLADFSQFYAAGFFDEVPFYSRYADVDFLKKLGIAKANALLIEFSLKYLNALTAYDTPRAPFLAAITVRECGKRDLLVPHLFVCHAECEEHLRGQLVLHSTTSSFGAALGRRVDAARPSVYQVLEEDLTVPGQVRAFIGHRTPMHPQSMPIDFFLTGATPAVAVTSI
ncbi:MAG TPA: hypothetical protein VMV69_12105 [Pirellulales bacterium]|nr:hypothetical protein [Pirellulales bacterium]